MRRAIKINITLPQDELESIDKYAKEENTTRSGLILRALRSFMRRREEEKAEKERRSVIKRASLDIKKLRTKAGKWDGVAEIRRWRDSR
ncbi:MAG: type II toxin-antitoxin system HicB family antitoxin [Deltaproteobacteria bacterium]|nr:type II toxin-antitoxin system HicB family antitoxin [Deltaproteobacteria bacterium]